MELKEGKRTRLGAKRELEQISVVKEKETLCFELKNAGVCNGETEKQRLRRWGFLGGKKQQQCDVTLSYFKCQVK